MGHSIAFTANTENGALWEDILGHFRNWTIDLRVRAGAANEVLEDVVLLGVTSDYEEGDWEDEYIVVTDFENYEVNEYNTDVDESLCRKVLVTDIVRVNIK